MRPIRRLALIAAVPAVASAWLAGSAGAVPRAPGQVVFVQTDNPAGNQVVAYDRAADGTLTPAGTFNTGGLGGVLSGSVVDHLASQGSLTYDASQGLLLAVNAGSNTVSVFSVQGDQLALRQVVGSGGAFPVSVAVERNVVYVLNAENGGSVQGYVVAFGHLVPVPTWNRPLGLDPTASPQFTNTPGQVAFSPDGTKLLVTTKANGSAIDVFRVGLFGDLSPSPVVNAQPAGSTPFALAFDAQGHALVTEAGPNTVTSFSLLHNGTLVPIQTAATGQAATCWIAGVANRPLFYASNAGSGSLTGLVSSPGGQLGVVGTNPTDAGTVDAAVSGDGQFLYVQTGAAGIVDEFRIQPNGSLAEVGSTTVPGAQGGEGIVAL